jgi:hypothetical protein
MSTYKVGQTLVYVPSEKRRGGPEPVVVTKVARKWVSFKGDGRYAHENRFDKDTGEADGAGYSSPGCIYLTMAEYQAKLDLDAAVLALRERLDWRGGPLPKDLTAQRVRLAMGMLLMGGDTDPLGVVRRLIAKLPDEHVTAYFARDELAAVRRLFA